MEIVVRGIGLDVTTFLHAYARKEIGFFLARFLDDGAKVTTTLAVENGSTPRTRCLLRLAGPLETVVVHTVEEDPFTAIDVACERMAEHFARKTRVKRDSARRFRHSSPADPAIDVRSSA